jgi:hypothetical protein
LSGGDIPELTRRKFISAAGKPVLLGADGSIPTGQAPAIFLHLDKGEHSSGFAINRGVGGTLALGGTLTGASSSPSDPAFASPGLYTLENGETLTLPTSVGSANELVVVKYTSETGSATVDVSTGDYVEGVQNGTVTLNGPYGSAIFLTKGDGYWWKVAAA